MESATPIYRVSDEERGTLLRRMGVPLVTEIHPKPLNCKSTPNTAGAHAGLLLDRVPHVEEFPPGNLLRRRPQKFQLGKNQKEEDDDGEDGERDNREKRSSEKETDERRLPAMIRQLCRRRSSQYLFSEISFGNRSHSFPPSFPLNVTDLEKEEMVSGLVTRRPPALVSRRMRRGCLFFAIFPAG